MAEIRQNLSAIRLALLAQQARAQGGSADLIAAEPIAIVGLGCRFPGGATDPQEFWRVLHEGIDAIEEIPSDRWALDEFFDPDPSARGKMSTRWGAFVRDVDRFDPAFFGIAPREAASMDPQQRLLLEVAWEALEDAGQTQSRLAGSRTGVFVAVYNNDYAQARFADRAAIDAYTSLGTAHSVAAGRLSFLLNLQGPSLVVDTACSSSLVAVHLACQSLKTRECDLAVAGGVSLILSPDVAISLSKWGFMAADGRCKTFDAAADGFVRGEGCGVVALKRLADALADGDRVLAVIRGTAVNQDGRSSVLTAPSGPAQAGVIRDALRGGLLDPSCVSYVEAHGTGTSLGDPIELDALAEVYGAGADECAVGSVKTNIGHLEAAAGVAGLMKVVLALGQERIPRHLHFHRLNPHASIDGTRLVVGSDPRPWPAADQPRFAGVSSFGFGGTNAHVIVEEAPRVARRTLPASRALVLAISARQDAALREQAARVRDLVDRHRDDADYLRDICFTAAVRRTHHEQRLVVVGDHAGDLVSGIDAFLRHEPAWNVAHARTPAAGGDAVPVFVFSGQGSQWWGMGRELVEHEPVFRDELQKVDALFQGIAGWSICEALDAPQETTRLNETEVAQPVIFALQVALAALWRSRGVVPAAVVGHSIGEIAAACVAGALDLESGARLVHHRGLLMQEATGRGRMAAVELGAAETIAALAGAAGTVSLAAINGPRATVISGEPVEVESLVNALTAAGVTCRFLPVSYAFHSTQMEPLAARLPGAIDGLTARTPTVPWVSTVTGTAVTEAVTPEYWRRNIAEPVRFADAIDLLLAAGHRTFLEVGPHPVLAGYVAQCAATCSGATTVVSSLRRGRPDRLSMLAALGALHVAGCAIDWAVCFPDGANVVSLPTYAWQRERFWIESRATALSAAPAVAGGPLRGTRLQSPFTTGSVFEYRVSADAPAFVRDHAIGDSMVFPAMGVVALAFDALEQSGADGDAFIENLSIQEPLYVREGARTLQCNVQPDGDGTRFAIAALSEAPADNVAWTTYASGRVNAAGAGGRTFASLDLAAIRSRCETVVTASEHYDAFAARGLNFGPSFTGVRQVWRGDREALAEVVLPDSAAAEAPAYAMHPCLLDACAQALFEALPDFGESDVTYLPVAIGAVRVSPAARGTVRAWGHASLRADAPADGASVHGDVDVYAEDGTHLARLERIVLQMASTAALVKSASGGGERLYEIEWVRAEPTASPLAAGSWLVLADQGGVGAAVATQLVSQGRACITVHATGHATTPDGRVLDPGSPEDCKALVEELAAGGAPFAGVLNFWNLDVPTGVVTDPEALERAWQLGCGSLLHLAQSLLTSSVTPLPRVWLFTRGAQAALTPVDAPLQAAALGLARTLAIEHRELTCACVDLEPGDEHAAVAALRAVGGSDAGECAIRNGERFVSRLVRRRRAVVSAPSAPARLEIHRRGTFDALELRPLDRRAPQAGEVEISVAAAGLNFRDVLNALGMYPGDPGQLGSECAGTIVSVGPGVDGFAVGDQVLAASLGSIGTHAFAPACLVAKKPASLSMAQAASTPIAFLTAEYGLTHLGGISRGDRVLIHAAAGGVGLAAVQIALRAGAEVVATAGSEEKRQYLRDLGVQHVFNSRVADFGAAVKTLTAGRGVDLVLNSLTGDFIPESLDALAPGGRFLEIGKTGVWSREQVMARRPDVSYHVIFLGELFEREPALSGELLQRIVGTIERGECRPLPVRAFPLGEAADAFRFMAQARHTGKIAITIGSAGAAGSEKAPVLRDDRSYVVTGGLGALGLHVAEALVGAGARRIFLSSRRSPSADAAARIAALEQKGVSVAVVPCDISKRDEVAHLFALAAAEAAIGGIVHAAGVVSDAPLLQQDHRRLAEVLAAKAAGACHLHALSIGQPLDFFVLFSSAASVLGSAGQSNYAAANAVLDGLAAYRHARGLPAVAINWGPWSEGGMVAALSSRDRQRIASQGWQALSPSEGGSILRDLMHGPDAQVAVLPINWRAYARQFGGVVPPLLASLVAPMDPAAAGRGSETLDARIAALPPAQQRDALAAHVRTQVLHVLGLSSSYGLDPHQGLRDVGLDSLMAVELRNRLQIDAGRVLSATLAFDFPTVDALTSHLADLFGVAPSGSRAPAAPAPSEVDAIQRLTDAEAEALLATELAAFDESEKRR